LIYYKKLITTNREENGTIQTRVLNHTMQNQTNS